MNFENVFHLCRRMLLGVGPGRRCRGGKSCSVLPVRVPGIKPRVMRDSKQPLEVLSKLQAKWHSDKSTKDTYATDKNSSAFHNLRHEHIKVQCYQYVAVLQVTKGMSQNVHVLDCEWMGSKIRRSKCLGHFKTLAVLVTSQRRGSNKRLVTSSRGSVSDTILWRNKDVDNKT